MSEIGLNPGQKCPYCGLRIGYGGPHECSQLEEIHKKSEARDAREKAQRERESKPGGYTLRSFLRDTFKK